MLKRLGLKILIGLNLIATPQQTEPLCLNPDFQKTIASYLVYSVPTISVERAAHVFDQYTFLDARSDEEYEVSHIPGARYIGYDDFSIKLVSDLKKDTPIIVYCSIGYRSEIIGEKLQKAGYTHVKNLYGSIFEWVNQGHPIKDAHGTTHAIHTYNKKWSKWVNNVEYKKVF